MQLIYEIFPVFLFFIAFKLYDIYVATIIGIISTFVQVIVHRFFHGNWERKQVITLFIFVVFGGMTLYFHNPIFVKWKPTIIFWIFSLIIIGSQLFTRKTLIHRMMEPVLQDKGFVPPSVWKRLNIIWAIFFLCLGTVNLYVAYHFSNDAWVNFKFYGVTSALIILSLFQAIYLARYMTETHK